MKEELAQKRNRHRKMEIGIHAKECMKMVVRMATRRKRINEQYEKRKKPPTNAFCCGGIKIITIKWCQLQNVPIFKHFLLKECPSIIIILPILFLSLAQ